MTSDTPEAGLGLVALLKEDFETYHRKILTPGLHAVVVHRIGAWGHRQPWLLRKAIGAVYKLVNDGVIRNIYGVEISRTTAIGRRLLIVHHQGVILGHATVIGDDCLVRQGVTLGQSSLARPVTEQPVVGDGVHFGAYAMVLGAVRIGDNAQIGPGAIVTRNVPARATAFAAPARILRAPEEQ